MKRYTILILTALLVLSAVGTAGAQEAIDGGRVMPVSPEMFGPSQFDLAAPWGVIDNQDVMPLILALNKTPGNEAPWAWDLNRDGRINSQDINAVVSRLGCTAADACYWR